MTDQEILDAAANIRKIRLREEKISELNSGDRITRGVKLTFPEVSAGFSTLPNGRERPYPEVSFALTYEAALAFILSNKEAY